MTRSNADRPLRPRAPARLLAIAAVAALLAPQAVGARSDRADPETPQAEPTRAGTASEKTAEKRGEERPDGSEKKSAIAGAVTRDRGRAPAKVFTNEDLEKLTGLGPELPTIKPPSPDAPPPPARTTAAEKAAEEGRAPGFADTRTRAARAADLDRRRAAAEARVLLAEQRVAELETRLLRIRNPYLARPEIPEDEKDAWEKLDGAGRAALTQRQLAEAKETLAEARAAYEAAPRRD